MSYFHRSVKVLGTYRAFVSILSSSVVVSRRFVKRFCEHFVILSTFIYKARGWIPSSHCSFIMSNKTGPQLSVGLWCVVFFLYVFPPEDLEIQIRSIEYFHKLVWLLQYWVKKHIEETHPTVSRLSRPGSENTEGEKLWRKVLLLLTFFIF